MNDDTRLGRLFRDGLHDIAPLHAPDRLRTSIKTETGRVRPRPRWLAFIKESPMRSNAHLTVGSPTARVAAIMVAALLIAGLVAGASFAGARILAAEGPIVVDWAGGGDYTTITEAVAAAEDGDEILVRPGTYTEAIVIDNDITLAGDGPVEDIVVTAPADGPTTLADGVIDEPFAALLVDSDATLSGLTFRGEPSQMIVQGGSPTLTALRFVGVGIPFGMAGTSSVGSSVTVSAGSTAVVRDNTLRNGGPIAVFNESTPRIEGNSLSGGPHIYLASFGDGTVVSGNTIDGTLRWAIGVFDTSTLVVEATSSPAPASSASTSPPGVPSSVATASAEPAWLASSADGMGRRSSAMSSPTTASASVAKAWSLSKATT